MTKRHSDWLWSGWVVAGCALEGLTLKSEEGSTLSAHVWSLTKVPRSTAPVSQKIRTAITLGFLLWLPIHFVSGGKI